MMGQFQLVSLPFAQGTPSAPSTSGKKIDFDYDLEVEFELVGPNEQRMDVYDLLRDFFDGQMFEVELQFDNLEMMK